MEEDGFTVTLGSDEVVVKAERLNELLRKELSHGSYLHAVEVMATRRPEHMSVTPDDFNAGWQRCLDECSTPPDLAPEKAKPGSAAPANGPAGEVQLEANRVVEKSARLASLERTERMHDAEMERTRLMGQRVRQYGMEPSGPSDFARGWTSCFRDFCQAVVDAPQTKAMAAYRDAEAEPAPAASVDSPRDDGGESGWAQLVWFAGPTTAAVLLSVWLDIPLERAWTLFVVGLVITLIAYQRGRDSR